MTSSNSRNKKLPCSTSDLTSWTGLSKRLVDKSSEPTTPLPLLILFLPFFVPLRPQKHSVWPHSLPRLFRVNSKEVSVSNGSFPLLLSIPSCFPVLLDMSFSDFSFIVSNFPLFPFFYSSLKSSLHRIGRWTSHRCSHLVSPIHDLFPR